MKISVPPRAPSTILTTIWAIRSETVGIPSNRCSLPSPSVSPPYAPAVENSSPMTSDSRSCKGCSSDPSQNLQSTPHLHPLLLCSPLPACRPPKPARLEILNGFALLNRLLPIPVDHSVKPDDAAPSLHPHYRDFITTTGCSAPVPRIGTLTLVGPPLGFSLNIGTTGSHVPHKSLDQVHATFMPGAAQAVNRFPLSLSWS